MSNPPARELAKYISDLVLGIQSRLPAMSSSASWDSSKANLEDQLYTGFSHKDQEKLSVALTFIKPDKVEPFEGTPYPHKKSPPRN